MNRLKLLTLLKKQQASCKHGQCYKYSNIVFSLLEEVLNCKKSSLNAAIDNLRTTLKTQDIQILPLYKIVKSNKDVFGFKWQPI
ncbi:MAG: hypothetical protein AB8U53_03750 [Rickettsia aeschlimannii]